jgi:hypothetical protein
VLNLEVAGRLLGGSGVCAWVYSASYVRNLAQVIFKHDDVGDAALTDSLTRQARDIA